MKRLDIKFFSLILFLLFLFWKPAAYSQLYFLTSHFDPALIPPAPDYSKTSNWAALPDRHDLADSTPKGLKENQANAKVDVFYIYPTTFTQKPTDKYQWNADVNNAALNKKTDESAILFQASVFNASCKVYAPRYRQAQITFFRTTDTSDKDNLLL